MGDNNLQGTIPTWVGHDLKSLIVLRLRANKFHGKTPTSLCDLSVLQVLDFSKNNITGDIPQCFDHIIALTNLKYQLSSLFFIPKVTMRGKYEIASFSVETTFAFKGTDLAYGQNLGYLTAIDLSSNNLVGQIPESITKLVNLASLNLSGNNLRGLIPNNIGRMETLQSLDFSHNNLSGRIPTSFSMFTFLTSLNLSFNNLNGKIPVGPQTHSFDTSAYIGNSGLCDPPYTNHCPGVAISPAPSTDHLGTDEDELITFGFYVSSVLGFFVGFWGVCGTIVIKASWRHAYFRFLNNLSDQIFMFLAGLKRRFEFKTNR